MRLNLTCLAVDYQEVVYQGDSLPSLPRRYFKLSIGILLFLLCFLFYIVEQIHFCFLNHLFLTFFFKLFKVHLFVKNRRHIGLCSDIAELLAQLAPLKKFKHGENSSGKRRGGSK